MNYQKTTIVGFLAEDPDVRETGNGTPVGNIRVGVSGRKDEQTEWFSCVLWKQTAEFAGQYAKKGNLVLVEGRIRTRSWENNEGEKRYKQELHATEFKILERKRDDEDNF